MKSAFKYILLGILTLFLNEAISQNNQSSKVEILKNFTEADFENIENRYKYSNSSIKKLYGIALLNTFSQIKSKFQVQIQINSDSIELVSVTHEGRYFNVADYYLNNYKGQIYIDYFYKDKIIYFRYEKTIDSKQIESLVSDKNQTEYIKFEDNYANCEKLDKLTGNRIEGKYVVLNESKTDTLLVFNLLNYEEQVTIKRNFLEKTGEWKTFDKEGKLIRKDKN